MTKRKPLAWYAINDRSSEVPDCDKCTDLWFAPMFAEACASVSIEHPTTAYELARRTVTQYHERRHPADMSFATRGDDR